jgi:hypothetical protein
VAGFGGLRHALPWHPPDDANNFFAARQGKSWVVGSWRGDVGKRDKLPSNSLATPKIALLLI